MDLQKLLHDLKDCPCDKQHTFATRMVEIESGLLPHTGELLLKAGFPKSILLVSDQPAMAAADGILPALFGAGFCVKQLIFPQMIYARIEQVREVKALLGDVDGILSVGTGSVNDVCRVAAYECGKQFAIFATAPSMDGFASDSAPIIENNFKNSLKAEQPSVILADTRILAAAPAELKAAGFGDMVAKYIGILDWRIANLLIDEYYCPAVADITLRGLAKVVSMADRVQQNDEQAAAAIMEGLILSGLGMKLAMSSRPASGAEHVISHYWECHKVARGIWPGYHGVKVGVASLLINRIYRNIADRIVEVDPIADPTDWDAVRAAYDASQHEELMRLNTPTVTDRVDPARLKAIWPEVRRLIFEILPTNEEMESMMCRAGAVMTAEDAHISKELMENGLRYHSYMRYRILLTRLLPMLQLDIMDFLE